MPKVIGVKLTDADAIRFEEAADAAGFKTVALWLRDLAEAALADPEPPKVATKRLRTISAKANRKTVETSPVLDRALKTIAASLVIAGDSYIADERKAKPTMPPGLDTSARMRWLRENR